MTIDHPYPLSWPAGTPRTERRDQKAARFHSDGRSLSIAKATSRLISEIKAFTKVGRDWRIDPDQVVISSNLKLRLDGMPRSNQVTPDDNGVAVYFEFDGVPHCFPCDAWDRIADNIAAIAAHLGAIRSIERWKVGDLKTAFTGWVAIEHNPEEPWFKVLQVPEDSLHFVVSKSYKKLRSAYHPDRENGDLGQFVRIQKAYERYLQS